MIPLRIFLILVALSIISSCSKEDTPVTSTDNKGNLQGYVYLVNTNNPISGAIVTADNLTTTSVGDGSYLIENIPDGQVTVTTTKSGYDLYSKTILISANQTTQLDVYLTEATQGNIVRGRVKRQDTQEPIEGVKISLLGVDNFTDTNGDYEFSNVDVGTHTITAEKFGYIVYEEEVIVSSSSVTTYDIELTKGTILDSDIVTGNLSYEGSPYFVKKSNDGPHGLGYYITLFENLVVEPKVIIKSEDSVRIDLMNTTIIGTEENPIIFTGDNPIQFSWFGIGSVNSTDMKHCIIEYAHRGMESYFNSQNNNSESVEIRNCFRGIMFYRSNIQKLYIHSCDAGISTVFGSYDYSELVIENCDIGIGHLLGNLSKAIIRDNRIGIQRVRVEYPFTISPPILDNITISNNTDLGIERIDFSSPGRDYLIKNCTFKQNGSAIGEVSHLGGTGDEKRIEFSKNIFEENTLFGLKGELVRNYFYSTSLFNNDFRSNGDFAFILETAFPDECEVYLDNNYIADNNGLAGVDLTTDGSGGQYLINPISVVKEFTNPRSVPNVNIGATWGGF